MNTYIQKVLAGTALIAVTATGITGASAMSDKDFKQALLKQMQIEENLSDAQLAEISGELDDISIKDILDSLKEEITDLEDTTLKNTLLKQLETVNNITLWEKFFTAVDSIYEVLDAHYEETYWDEDRGDEGDWDEEYDFAEEKQYIIEELNEEKDYIDNETLKAEITATITKLTAETDEDSFFDALDALFEKVDSYYEEQYGDEDWDDEQDWDEEFDFDELKKEILRELSEEKQHIDDEALKTEVDTAITTLTAETDEDSFFDTLDALFEKVDSYYEEMWIDVITGDEFLDEEFDFDTEKSEIITQVKEELSELEDTALKNQLLSELVKLESANNEHAFFNTLDALYKKLDNYYGEDEDFEDEDFDDEDFDENTQN